MTTKYIEVSDSSYTAVDINELPLNKPLPCDISIKDGAIVTPLYNRGIIFTASDRNMLKGKGITEVYIRSMDKSSFAECVSGGGPQKPATKDEPKAFKQYSSNKEQHYQIDKLLLVSNTEITFSLFIMNKFNLDTLVIAAEKTPVKIDEKILSAAGDIMIKNSDIPLFHDYIKSLLTAKDVPESDKLKIKANSVRENSKLLIRDLLENPRSGEKIKESKALVNNMIDCIMENRETVYDMVSLKSYDYYTYTHSVNVAVMSIGMGIAVDLHREDVEKLGTGALLHDIGKSSISHEILNKQGKLDGNEYGIMKNHVIEGEKILREHKEIHKDSLIPVLQHHEKLTGKGYPFRLSGDAIKPFGRITAIADCYDALTTQRPYKPAFTPFYALSIVAKETGDYDPELLRIFIRMLGDVR